MHARVARTLDTPPPFIVKPVAVDVTILTMKTAHAPSVVVGDTILTSHVGSFCALMPPGKHLLEAFKIYYPCSAGYTAFHISTDNGGAYRNYVGLASDGTGAVLGVATRAPDTQHDCVATVAVRDNGRGDAQRATRPMICLMYRLGTLATTTTTTTTITAAITTTTTSSVPLPYAMVFTDGAEHVYKYDFSSALIQLPSMNIPRQRSPGLTSLNSGQLFVLGGYFNSRSLT